MPSVCFPFGRVEYLVFDLSAQLQLTMMYPFYSFSVYLEFLNCLLPRSYANDDLFRFCQQCGYVRKDVQENGTGGPSKKLKVDESKISERLDKLSQHRGSSRYVKQKIALECEFVNFLSHLATPKMLASALPEDVTAFLVWKDRGGKTRVHLPECLHLFSQNASTSFCGCPKRLAYGTVNALIGKLQAIFAGRYGMAVDFELWQSGGGSLG